MITSFHKSENALADLIENLSAITGIAEDKLQFTFDTSSIHRSGRVSAETGNLVDEILKSPLFKSIQISVTIHYGETGRPDFARADYRWQHYGGGTNGTTIANFWFTFHGKIKAVERLVG